MKHDLSPHRPSRSSSSTQKRTILEINTLLEIFATGIIGETQNRIPEIKGAWVVWDKT